jgi:hypothetical protein
MNTLDHRYAGKTGQLLRRLLEAYVLFPLFAVLLLISAWTSVIHLVSVEGTAASAAAATRAANSPIPTKHSLSAISRRSTRPSRRSSTRLR